MHKDICAIPSRRDCNRIGFKTIMFPFNCITSLVKDFNAEIAIPHAAGRELYNFAFYYGPNDLKVMEDVEFNGEKVQLDEIIPLGGWLVSWISRFVIIPIFDFLGKFIKNYGLIILLLTLIIKLVIMPLFLSTPSLSSVSFSVTTLFWTEFSEVSDNSESAYNFVSRVKLKNPLM